MPRARQARCAPPGGGNGGWIPGRAPGWGGLGALTAGNARFSIRSRRPSNREIARLLHVSEKTVKTHVSSVLAKLGVQDRTQAALYAVRHADRQSSSAANRRPERRQ